MIYIFCGKVHSGKTSRLKKWIKNLHSIDGILAPIVDGKKNLLAIKSNEMRELEVSKSNVETEIVSVGKYLFNEETFRWGREVLKTAFESNIDWLIIDEVGILELNDKGLEPAVSKIFNDLHQRPYLNIVLVVRYSLVDDIIEKYKLKKEQIEFLKL